MAQHSARAVESAVQVDAHNPMPRIVGHAHQQSVVDDAGVVDQDAHFAQCIGNLVHHSVDLLKAANIGVDFDCFAAFFDDGADYLFGFAFG